MGKYSYKPKPKLPSYSILHPHAHMVSSKTAFVVPNFSKAELLLHFALFFLATALPEGCMTPSSTASMAWPTSSCTGQVDRLVHHLMIPIPSLSRSISSLMQSLMSGSADINQVQTNAFSGLASKFNQEDEWINCLCLQVK